MLDEIVISRAIIDRYFKKLMDNLQVDVAIAGGGPAGLTAAYYLAKRKVRVAVYEKKLSIGGGMWGGGMMFNEIVVQEEAKKNSRRDRNTVCTLPEKLLYCRLGGGNFYLNFSGS